MDLVIGQRYLVNIAPWGLHTVRYLGPSGWLKGHSVIENPVTLRKYIIRTEQLRPLLAQVRS